MGPILFFIVQALSGRFILFRALSLKGFAHNYSSSGHSARPIPFGAAVVQLLPRSSSLRHADTGLLPAYGSVGITSEPPLHVPSLTLRRVR